MRDLADDLGETPMCPAAMSGTEVLSQQAAANSQLSRLQRRISLLRLVRLLVAVRNRCVVILHKRTCAYACLTLHISQCHDGLHGAREWLCLYCHHKSSGGGASKLIGRGQLFEPVSGSVRHFPSWSKLLDDRQYHGKNSRFI